MATRDCYDDTDVVVPMTECIIEIDSSQTPNVRILGAGISKVRWHVSLNIDKSHPRRIEIVQLLQQNAIRKESDPRFQPPATISSAR